MGFLGASTSRIFSNQPCHTARSLVHILFLQRQLTPLTPSLTSRASTATAPLPVLLSLVLEPPGSSIQIHFKHERVSAFTSCSAQASCSQGCLCTDGAAGIFFVPCMLH